MTPNRSLRVPVIVLTGHLGAGKTTLLNHLLSAPDSRIGVVINDFGAINVDAMRVRGQVDDPASIAGGCLCCLPDAGGLDEALEKLTQPRLALDAVIVEASGLAEPLTLTRMIRYSGIDRVRPGGLIEVVDAAEYFGTVDEGGAAPIRFAAASLVVVNKSDLASARTMHRIEERIRSVNADVHIVRVSRGRVDPALVFDPGVVARAQGELPFDDLIAERQHEHPHHHAQAVSVSAPDPVEPGRLVDLLEEPPPGVYRLKGSVHVLSGRRLRQYVINVLGHQVHVAGSPDDPDAAGGELVAIGTELDPDLVRSRLCSALRPADRSTAHGLRRLQRHRRLSD